MQAVQEVRGAKTEAVPKRRLAVVGWVLEGLRGAITSLALAAREHGVVFLLRRKTGVRAASVLVVCGVRRLPGCRRRSASLWVYKFTFQFCSCAFPPHLSVVPALLSACPDAVGGAASPGPWPQAPKQLSQVCEQHRGASCHGQGEAAHHGPASWLPGGEAPGHERAPRCTYVGGCHMHRGDAGARTKMQGAGEQLQVRTPGTRPCWGAWGCGELAPCLPLPAGEGSPHRGLRAAPVPAAGLGL